MEPIKKKKNILTAHLINSQTSFNSRFEDFSEKIDEINLGNVKKITEELNRTRHYVKTYT